MRPGILFCMRYPDDEGFVWKTVARLRDLIAAELTGFDCHIAFPRLTGRSVHQFDHLCPVELDCYRLDRADKARLKGFVEQNRVSTIVYMSALPSTIDLPFLRRLGLTTVNTEEDSFDPARRDSRVRRWAKFVVRRVLQRQLHDLHIANSEAQGAWLMRYSHVPPARLRVVPNGVDCEYFRPVGPKPPDLFDPSRRRVICAGQARPVKRLETIIHCAAGIVAQPEFADVDFVYVGDGEMLAQWRALVADLGIGARFHFAGHQADLRPYYQSASVMVHAAELESFGLVLAEAMACGLPVVACAAPGPRDIIADNQTGRLVPIGDEGALAAALESYLRDRALTEAHGSAARKRAVERFSIHRQARDIAAAIRKVSRRSRCAA
jgi:glycosyltransferase involved in cell wall biosynthesis